MAGLWMILGALNGLIAVAAGAYGWHSLGGDDTVREIFMMGVSYQMWHGLAIVAVALIATRPAMTGSPLPALAAICFGLGILAFSGSLYAFAMLGYVPVSGAAPIGGGLLMTGWALVAAMGWKISR